MPDTRRQQLFDAIVTRLATILIVNAYATNVGDNVFPWRDPEGEPFGEQELDALFVRDPDDEATSHVNTSRYDRLLTVEVGVATIKPPVDRQLRRLIADVSKCLMEGDRRWGGLAEDTNIVGDKMGTKKLERNTGNAVVVFQFRYRVRDNDPYSK
jgi:hypothetical protein